MILLFTDFGQDGLYVGQMKAVFAQQAAGVPVIDLCHQAPVFAPEAAAYLLAAYSPAWLYPDGAVFVAVVDPGVGSARAALALCCDGRWFVGPDNGLFEIVIRQATQVDAYRIDSAVPPRSSSFHGRDVFAPVAAALAGGRPATGFHLRPTEPIRFLDWPDDLPRIVHVDHYGNVITGYRAAALDAGDEVVFRGQTLPKLRTFCEAEAGIPFCYENANGLLEIALAQAAAFDYFPAPLGEIIQIISRDKKEEVP